MRVHTHKHTQIHTHIQIEGLPIGGLQELPIFNFTISSFFRRKG